MIWFFFPNTLIQLSIQLPWTPDSKTFDNNNLVIGWDYRNNSASSGYVGDIGAVYFYNTDLSLDQVTQNYNATKSRYGH